METALSNFSGIVDGIDTMCHANQRLQAEKLSMQNISKTIESQQEALEKNTFSCKEICEALGITEPTLIKRRNAGLIPYIKLGRNFYYLKPEVQGEL